MHEVRNAYEILAKKCKGKRLLSKPKCIWEDNMRTDFREIR
jgi:hypothetical protein